MKKKYFVFSDVHGELAALQNSLRDSGYDKHNPDHILVSIGDNFDRGPESAGVYDFLMGRKAICIKGNHETFFQEALEKGTDGEFVLFNFLHNGLDKTIESFGMRTFPQAMRPADLDNTINFIKDNYGSRLMNWLKDMPLYFETKNYIFVHAGINPRINDWKQSGEDFMLWDIEYSHVPCPNTFKTVVIGHHHAFRVRNNIEGAGYCEDLMRIPWFGCTDDNRPVRIGNKIAIDPCSNLTHQVNVIVIEDEPLDENAVKESKDIPVDNSIRIDVDPNFYTRATIRTTDNRPVTVEYDPFEVRPWPDYQGMWADAITTAHDER